MKYAKQTCCRFCKERHKHLPSHVPICHLNPRRPETIEKRRQKMIGKKLPKETRRKLSNTVNRKIVEGTWHNSFSRARTHEYKGVKLYGKWELAYAKFLDEKGIRWSRPTETFSYEFEGKIRKYTPDFYLIDLDEYLEIKGYETEKDHAKWRQFPKKHRVVKGKELFELGLIDSYRNVGG